MPTARRRYQVTETPEVARAIDVAATRWPDEERSRLLVRVIAAGERALLESPDDVVAARRRAIRRASGMFDGMYGPDYLERLREDWPD